MTVRLRAELCLLTLLIAGAAAHAQEQPGASIWVTDDADMLSSAEEQILTHRLRSYADTTSTQIAVAIRKNLGGTDIATYATELGQKWGVGQTSQDNGIVILVAREEREIFIAVGYGLEGVIPDAIASRIVRNVIAPYFREGEFFQGLLLAVNEIMLRAAGEYVADTPVPATIRASKGVDFCGVLFFVFLLVMFVKAITRNRGGGQGPRHHGGSDAIIPLMFLLGHASGRGGFGGGGFGGGGFGGGGFGAGGFGGGGFGGGGAGGGW